MFRWICRVDIERDRERERERERELSVVYIQEI